MSRIREGFVVSEKLNKFQARVEMGNMMQTTRLYFGERFRFEFSPADTRTPQLGKRERDPSGNHHFDYFIRAVSDHLQKKGIPADTRKGGSYFELLLDGKKDRTLAHQERIYRECEADTRQRFSLEEQASDVWKQYFEPRLRELETFEKQGPPAKEPMAGGYDVEDPMALMRLNKACQQEECQVIKRDFSEELETLREIRKVVKKEGALAILTEPVLKKLGHNPWIPANRLENPAQVIQAEADLNARLRAEEELCEPEKYPLSLDYRLCAPGKPGSVQVGDEHFEFPNLPVIVRMIQRCLPAANHEPPRLNAHRHGNQSLLPDGKGDQTHTVVDVSDILRQRKDSEHARPVAPGTSAKILGSASMFRKRS
jgi:hypothetical protein